MFYSWRPRTNVALKQSSRLLPFSLLQSASRVFHYHALAHTHTRMGEVRSRARHGERQQENNNQAETFDQLLCQFFIHNNLLKEAFFCQRSIQQWSSTHAHVLVHVHVWESGAAKHHITRDVPIRIFSDLIPFRVI